MTKEAAKKKRIEVRADGPEDYHEREDYGINYAFQGYGKNLYFTSDRAKALDAEFRLADGSPLKGYGLEMEEECYGIESNAALVYTLQNLAFSRLPRNLFKYQHDGSLSGDSSAEAITQVMTKEFIRNNYQNFRNTMETIFHLVDAVKRVPWSKMDDMAEVFKGCNQFVVKRLDDAAAAGLISQADYRKITASSVKVDFGEAGK